MLCVVTDGASGMLGTKSGVSTQLKDMFPKIITWHYLNHSLELAIHDAIRDQSSMNYFQSFVEVLYHQSAKNCKELEKNRF